MGKVTEKIRPNLFFFKRAADHFEMRFKNRRFCGSWDECEDWLRNELGRPKDVLDELQRVIEADERLADSTNPQR